jgi:hypothetical protein
MITAAKKGMVMMKTRGQVRSLPSVLAAAPALAAALLLVAVAPASGQTIQPPYDAVYTLTNLGLVPSLPTRYGGLTFLTGNPNVLVIGGNANVMGGALYSIGVTRDALNHITGFTGTAALFSEGQFNDGGVVFGPSNVLFYTRFPTNEIGEIKSGSTMTDKVVGLTPLGIGSSVGALNFVPAGFPGAGQLKIVSYNTGQWYTASFAPDGTGTYDITSPVLNTTIAVGPEGFVYVPVGSPIFPSGTSMLVAEYDNNVITTYQIDASGNPIPATRAVFVTGLTGAEGAVIDPMTGDFLFSTFGGNNQVIVVQGFAPPPTNTPAGVATNTPTQTSTPTNTAVPPTTTRTPTLGAAVVVPTLSFPMLALFGLMLAAAAFLLMRR